MAELDGKVAIVTGAGRLRGIGRAAAVAFARLGADVVVTGTGRDPSTFPEDEQAVSWRDVESTADQVRELGRRALPLIADARNVEDAQHTVRRAVEEFGRVDILVNNAAYIAGGVKAEDETYDDIRRTLAVNVEAPIMLAQACYPGMREAGNGSIVNISSITASVGVGRFPQAVYAVTKGGIEALTREWAAQWSRYGIRVNSLAPGWIETEINEQVNAIPKVQEWVLRNTLLPRSGQPDDFDGALLLLASDAGRYITGQKITVDGGWTAH